MSFSDFYNFKQIILKTNKNVHDKSSNYKYKSKNECFILFYILQCQILTEGFWLEVYSLCT